MQSGIKNFIEKGCINLIEILKYDYKRYKTGKPPKFQIYFRKAKESKGIINFIYRCLFIYYRRKNLIELDYNTQIGPGLYIGHPYGITINPKVILGKNCNIHKGVTIGQENRGIRIGTPFIGNEVWIGVNSTIVGKISIGDDVLIAPNTYVNCDIPSHSIVFGNPCIIKNRENATEKYINNKI